MRFSDIPGQHKAKNYMVQAVTNERLAHAQLLVGPMGVGQLDFALAVAQYVNCTNRASTDHTDSCGQCQSCRLIAQLQHPDLTMVLPIVSSGKSGKPNTSDDFLEALRLALKEQPFLTTQQWGQRMEAENRQLNIPIAEIRALQQKVGLRAYMATYKVVIVWGASLMNTEASNAFLKLLEEPPESTLLLLVNEGESGLLATISSRTQRVALLPAPLEEVADALTEKFQIPPNQAHEAALLSEGCVAVAFDIATNANESFAEALQQWFRLCYEGKLNALSEWAGAFSRQNREYQKLFLQYALQRLRSSLLVGLGSGALAQSAVTDQAFNERFAKVLHTTNASRIDALLNETLRQVEGNANTFMAFTQLGLEVGFALRLRP